MIHEIPGDPQKNDEGDARVTKRLSRSRRSLRRNGTWLLSRWRIRRLLDGWRTGWRGSPCACRAGDGGPWKTRAATATNNGCVGICAATTRALPGWSWVAHADVLRDQLRIVELFSATAMRQRAVLQRLFERGLIKWSVISIHPMKI